jgi:large conductance mechanosensitive channel
MKGFRTFLLRGNVVDLAVGVVIGGAFGAVVKGLVDGFITPLIALAAGKPDFSGIHFDVGGTQFPIGGFIGALVMFLLTAAVIYFFVILPMNTLTARLKRNEVAPAPTTKPCPECLSEIPLAARRCAHCTSLISDATASLTEPRP